MFENLSSHLTGALDKIRGYGKINEDNINDVVRELRIALLEADVNYDVVKEFISNVKEKAMGEEVQKSLKPSEVFAKIVRDELVDLLGGDKEPLNLNGNPATLMLVGLQGSGKTTTIGKLALLLRKRYHKNPLLVAGDIYRPAAIDQLKQIGKELNITVYSEDTHSVAELMTNAIQYAKDNKYDYVLLDTAGRLQIDDAMMKELVYVEETTKPQEVLLVIDSMMGQDAINVINGFNKNLKLTGAIVTKLDGDTKGGVALSIRHLTDVPIKFIGTSEKMDGIDEFYPDRMADRILGMGDIVTMAEHASEVLDEDVVTNSAKRMQSGKFDLEDFLATLKQIKKMGPLEDLIKMVPGAFKMGLNNVKIDPKDMAHIEAIIQSMTPEERRNPSILKASRKIRIAKGSNRSVEEVNRLLKQFDSMKVMMKQMKGKYF